MTIIVGCNNGWSSWLFDDYRRFIGRLATMAVRVISTAMRVTIIPVVVMYAEAIIVKCKEIIEVVIVHEI